MKKKFVAIISVVAMLVTMFPATVFAENTEYAMWGSSTSLPTKGTYKLNTDVNVTVGSGNYVTLSGDLTLDLNGYTITVSGNSIGNAFFVNNAKYTLTIEDSSENGNGKITNSGQTSSSCTLVQINKGTLVMKGGTLENTTSSGYALFVNSDSSAVITGGTIINTAKGGNAVQVNGKDSEFTINGGTIENTVNGGKSVFVNNGVLNVNGGTVKNSGTYGSDAAIYANSGATSINITGGKIQSNSTGVYAAFTPVTVTGGEFNTEGNAFQTRHTTIEPKNDVIVNSDGALFYAWSDSDNKIVGGIYNLNEIERAYPSGGEPNTTTIEGGAFSVSPTDYVTDDEKAVASITNDDETKYIVGTSEKVSNKINELVEEGSKVDVEKGDIALNLPVEGVIVSNSGSGTVTVNDNTVSSDGELCIHKWGNWVTTVKPTSTRRRTCYVC